MATIVPRPSSSEAPSPAHRDLSASATVIASEIVPRAATRAHAQKNALSVIDGLLSVLDRSIIEPNDRARFHVLRDTVDDLRALVVDELASFAPSPASEQPDAFTSLDALAKTVCTRVAALAETRGVRLAQDCEACCTVSGDAAQLTEAILNLVLNAIEATPRGETVIVRTHDFGDGWVECNVTNLGPRFAPQEDDTRRRARAAGHGFGIAIVNAVAAAHGGSLRIDDVGGAGASASLRLPSLTVESGLFSSGACTLEHP